MNLNNLIAFIKAAEYGNVTKAAEELFVTQQTLSRQIMVLEDELGTELFYRGKTLQLTQQGELCLPEAKKIVAHCEQLQKYASSKQKGLRGILTIGYPGGMRMDLLTKALIVFSAQNRQVEVDLRPMLFNELLEEFKANHLDVIFIGKSMLEGLKHVEFFELIHNPLRVLVAKDHPLAQKKKISLSELAEEPFIMMERRIAPESIDHQIELCRKSGFSPRVVSRVRDINDMKIYVAIGKGVGLISDLDRGLDVGITRLELEEEDDYYNLICLFHEKESRPVVVEYLKTVQRHIDLVREEQEMDLQEAVQD